MDEDIRKSILQLIAKAKALIPPDNLPDLPPRKFTGGAPDWHPFEHHVWAIVSHLKDPGVVGHVISTLLKMKAPDFAKEVQPFLEHRITWIRNKAKKYCKRYGGIESGRGQVIS